MWTGNYNPVNNEPEQGITLAGSMWTGNYNTITTGYGPISTLAGSMWTGNYNSAPTRSGSSGTLAGSMWTGNYNYGEWYGSARAGAAQGRVAGNRGLLCERLPQDHAGPRLH